MRPRDAQVSSGDWRDLARCQDGSVDMVFDEDEVQIPYNRHFWVAEKVRFAKQVCAECPVQAECLAFAKTQEGVWAELTMMERDRLRLSNQPKAREANRRSIVKCEICGYRCVPANQNDSRCDGCIPEDARPKSAEDFKEVMIAMIVDRKPYGDIARELNLPYSTVRKACRKWGYPSLAVGNKVGSRRDKNMLAPCGTPAAQRRHQRRNEPITTCACAQPGASNPKRTKKNGWVS